MQLRDPWARTTAFFGAPVEAELPGRKIGPAAAAVTALAVAASLLVPAGIASADPSATTWQRLRTCESGGNYAINTGNSHYGAYQFDLATWRSVGGSGYPNLASKGEQDARALILYRERGWQPWQCASILGLHEDSDARSGYIGDIHVPTGGAPSGGAPAGVPAFPGGTHQYWYGETSIHIKTFQDEMHARGYFPAGTGQYGPLTFAMVKQLQRLNGLAPLGYIGPNTWKLAWTGRYTAPPAAPAPPAPTPAAPAFPGGTHQYHYGETSIHIKTFQDEMHARGYFPAGTGQYGPLTLAMVKQLQRLNGLAPLGYIGPNTWKLAWTGRYTAA